MCIYYTECAILASTIILFRGVYKYAVHCPCTSLYCMLYILILYLHNMQLQCVTHLMFDVRVL